jgi:hypothetical protein
MFKILLVASLVATAYSQQIGVTNSCATCVSWGGNFCASGNSQNTCWSKNNMTLSSCTSYIKTPYNCTGIQTSCSNVTTSGNNQGTVWPQYFLSNNQFCVVNVTNYSPAPLDVSIYQTRLGWSVLASNDTVAFSQTNMNVTSAAT